MVKLHTEGEMGCELNVSFIYSKNSFIRKTQDRQLKFIIRNCLFFSIELTILETQRVPSILLIFYNVSMLFINCLVLLRFFSEF